jgi:hypothetical protein
MKTLFRLFVGCSLYGMSILGIAQTTPPGSDLILVRTTAKSPAEVIDAVKAYSEANKWVYMGSSTVRPKQGEVTMVKFCIPQVGQILWPLGLQLSALLPCGNVGVYQNQGKTEISMLHPRYLQILYPNPEVDRAVAVATPLLLELLDTVAK